MSSTHRPRYIDMAELYARDRGESADLVIRVLSDGPADGGEEALLYDFLRFESDLVLLANPMTDAEIHAENARMFRAEVAAG